MPRASLQRHFMLWLAGGAACLLAAAAAWQFAQVQRESAQAQDLRLAARIAGWPAAWPVPEGDLAGPQATLVARVSRVDGERVSGDPELAAYPWPGELRVGDAPRFHYTQVRGRLMRAAAALRVADGASVVVQAAEPAVRRLPPWERFASGALSAFAAGVLLMLALAGSAAALARRWVVGALQVFGAEGAPPVQGPAELAPALERVRALHEGERVWVEQQRRFLADAAHQLRTPMAVLRTQLQAAMQAGGESTDALAAMLHTVDRATGLANQLLSLTRLEQLKHAGQLQGMPVVPAVREAVVELSPLIARKRLGFALEGDDFQARGDPVMLGELLRNLLANAIHYSAQEGAMGVILRGTPPLREIVVWDEGPGIDDEVKPRLFTPFSASKGGVGLGLSICQQIAHAMGASVRLFNRVDGNRTVGVDAVVSWPAE